MDVFLFNPTRYKFDLVNALGCALASFLSYEDSAVGKQTVNEWGFDKFEDFVCRQHYGIAFGNDEMILIAFRGTNERADWLANLNILFRRSPMGWVHRGFMKGAELFWPRLPQKISEFRDRNQSIWVTGHSLGGALAVLATAKLLADDNLDIAGLYTFGQPPVGARGFCSNFENRLENRYFRFVNHTDAVSDVPIFFREHVGEVRYFDTSGTLWEGEPPWRVGFLDQVRAPGKYGGLSQFTAHSMKNYIELIRKHASL